METIRVNMNPNPLDVQTIHASQNDGEARQWGFELHNNGDVIGSSEVTDQITFKAYEGGTEEILPTNGSTPTTSPFIGNIKYPQGLLSDQEFLYRESPAIQDGLARIDKIKGNTLVWNQLVPTANKDFSNSETDSKTYLVFMCRQYASPYTRLYFKENQAAGILNVILEPTFSGDIVIIHNGSQRNFFILGNNIVNVISGHKYLLSINIVGNDPATVGGVSTKDLMIFDLTQMGLDSITDPSDFTSLFSLPYYDFNQGSLLSFNGNGIKTVGKNLFDLSQFANGTITFENGVLTGTGGQFYTAYNDVVNKGIELKYPKNTQIMISFDARTEQNQSSTGGGLYLTASENGTATQLAVALNNMTTIQHKTVTIPSDRHIDKLGWTYGSGSNNIWHITNFQVEFGTETSYEPYTSSTLSLPISTYFPNGMKSAGSVYDELTESKAISRVGSVDLGSLTWGKGNTASGHWRFTAQLSSVKKASSSSSIPNLMCAKYITVSPDGTWIGTKGITSNNGSTNMLLLCDEDYSDVSSLVASLQGVYLYYELATESETSFTTASLVTENAEIPLSNEDGVLIGKCTEQLSAEPGFHDAKIKLSDSDGDVYSNKLQLHVERSPQ